MITWNACVRCPSPVCSVMPRLVLIGVGCIGIGLAQNVIDLLHRFPFGVTLVLAPAPPQVLHQVFPAFARHEPILIPAMHGPAHFYIAHGSNVRDEVPTRDSIGVCLEQWHQLSRMSAQQHHGQFGELVLEYAAEPHIAKIWHTFSHRRDISACPWNAIAMHLAKRSPWRSLLRLGHH